MCSISRVLRSIPKKFAPFQVSSAPLRKSSLHLTCSPLHSEKVRSISSRFRSTPKKFAPFQVFFAPLRKNSLHLTFPPLHSGNYRSIQAILTPFRINLPHIIFTYVLFNLYLNLKNLLSWFM